MHCSALVPSLSAHFAYDHQSIHKRTSLYSCTLLSSGCTTSQLQEFALAGHYCDDLAAGQTALGPSRTSLLVQHNLAVGNHEQHSAKLVCMTALN